MSVDQEERDDGSTRRGFLSGVAGGGLAGLLLTAANAEGATGAQSVSASLGQVASGVYKWADPAGYAGANAARSNVTPETGAVYVGWDSGSETIYRGNGSSWVEVADLGAIGSGGSGSSPIVNAADYSGSTLDAKLVNAFNDLPGGHGEVYVFPKDDGTAWDWDTLDEDPSDWNGIGVRIAGGTEIQLVNDNVWAWNVKNTDNGNDVTDNRTFHVIGGDWRGQNVSPNGWVRVYGQSKAYFEPFNVTGFNNGTDGTIVRIESRDTVNAGWVEDCTFRNIDAKGAERGVEFVVNGSTTSFVDTRFEHCSFNVDDYGVICRGNMRNVQFDNLAIFPQSDGCIAVQNDDSATSGALFVTPRIDNGPAGASNVTAFQVTANAGSEGPFLFLPETNAVSSVFDDDGSGNTWQVMDLNGPQLELGARGQGQGYFTAADGVAQMRDGSGTPQIVLKTGGIDFRGNTFQDPTSNETADSMTADPETASEDGYIEVRVNGTDYQIPIYAP